MANTFDAIGAIAMEFLERAAAFAVKNGGSLATEDSDSGFEGGDGGGSLMAESVGELVEMNHRLLCALGVGHPALERVCEVARVHGCKTKLTGAGEYIVEGMMKACSFGGHGRSSGFSILSY